LTNSDFETEQDSGNLKHLTRADLMIDLSSTATFHPPLPSDESAKFGPV